MVVAPHGVPLMTDTDTKSTRKMAREPEVNETDAALPKQGSKTSLVLGLLQRVHPQVDRGWARAGV